MKIHEYQGKDNAREFLRENPDLAVEIENKVRDALGIPPRAAVEAADADAGVKPGRGKAAKE